VPKRREGNSFTLQEIPLAVNNANGLVGEVVKETTREIKTTVWATRALKTFKHWNGKGRDKKESPTLSTISAWADFPL
jgi:hypothetical protein